jgi:DNA-binding response OmpR family regulator
MLLPTLVVDADGVAANRLAERLRDGGFETDVATSCTAAWAAVAARHYGTMVVVADLGLMVDLECLVGLRARARRTWIIVIGLRARPEEARVAFEHGADSMLTTPFAIEELTFRLSALGGRARPW